MNLQDAPLSEGKNLVGAVYLGTVQTPRVDARDEILGFASEGV
jgi:hypothetical protein